MDTPNGSGPNGADPSPERLVEHLERSRATRERITDELRELLLVEERLHDAMAEQLAEAKARRDGYRRALEQLTGEPRKKPGPKKATPNAGDWVVSDAKIAEVWELVRKRDDQFTAASVSKDVAGLSPETARRALNTLRERELIRAAGKVRGGGIGLAVMPGAGELEATGAA